jgi:hypothetical protein
MRQIFSMYDKTVKYFSAIYIKILKFGVRKKRTILVIFDHIGDTH